MADGPLLYNAAALAAVLGANGPQVLFKYSPQGTLSSNPGFGGTFTRADASTCATYVDANGVVQTVAANICRDGHYIGGVRTALLEGSRQNAQVRSEALDDVAWSKGASSISANAIVAPDGNTTADKIVEDGTVAAHYAANGSYGFTISTAYTLSVFAKAGERTWCYIWGRSLGLANAWFNLSAGTVGTVSGTETGVSAKIQALGNSWYRCSLTFTSTASATNSWGFGPTTADNTSSYAGNGTSGAYFWGAMAENAAAFPSSYIATGASATTRAADALSFPFSPVPQSLTVYADYISGGDESSNPYRFIIGNVGTSSLGMNGDATPNPQPLAWDGAGNLNFGHFSATFVAGDEVEVALSANASWQLSGSLSKNGGAAIAYTAGTNTARTLPASFSAQTINVGMSPGGAIGVVAFKKLIVLAGSQSLATMRAA